MKTKKNKIKITRIEASEIVKNVDEIKASEIVKKAAGRRPDLPSGKDFVDEIRHGKEPTPRSLYDCVHALTQGKKVWCAKGLEFPTAASVKAIQRGSPMVYSICQNCSDFEPFDNLVPFPTELKGGE